MKWTVPYKGQRRVIEKFAWYPVKLTDTNVKIWWEPYFACQEYDYNFMWGMKKWNTQFITQDVTFNANGWINSL